MITSKEITFYQNRIDFLEDELAKTKLKVLDLEQQLICSLGTENSKSVSLVNNSSQYDSSDIVQESPAIEVLTSDILTEIAESSVAQSSFVYDQTVGMYYDQLSKCYYDAEKSLYYEPSSGVYYRYNEVVQKYEFHSQLNVQDFNTITHMIKSRTKCSDTNNVERKKLNNLDECKAINQNSEVEDGEILSNDEEHTVDNDGESSSQIYLQKMPEIYKSCIRVVVKSSNCLAENTLFVLTIKGASIGRDKSLKHDIILSDPTVSRTHCSIRYDEDIKEYFIIDEGSFTGTFVNEKRIGQHKEVSQPHLLQNLTKLRVGNSFLELHIHPHLETCHGCEPWNLKTLEENKIKSSVYISKDQQRIQQLKMIKKKYGLKNMNYEKHPLATRLSKNYLDRSKKRRLEVGSEIDVNVDASPSSVNKPLTESNIGHKILTKMGWKSGKSLGKSQAGILEPIQAEMRLDERAGIGRSACVNLDNVEKISKLRTLMITKSRYDKSSIGKNPADMDHDSYNSDF